VAAFCATEGGNAGTSEVAAAGAASGDAGAVAAGSGVACGDTAAGWAAGAIATEGGTVWV
jgi:hypothetical protein